MKFHAIAVMTGLVLAIGQAAHAAPPSAKDISDQTDRELVRDVVSGVEVAHDSSNEQRLRELLAPDVQFIVNGKLLMSGGDQTAAMLIRDQRRINPGIADGHYGLIHHILDNVLVTLNGDDTASATAYCLTIGYDKSARRPGIISIGQYSEVLVKRDGRWQVQKLVAEIEQGNDEMSKAMGLGPYHRDK